MEAKRIEKTDAVYQRVLQYYKPFFKRTIPDHSTSALTTAGCISKDANEPTSQILTRNYLKVVESGRSVSCIFYPNLGQLNVS